ncbi:MAG TPA: hypothetical protein VFF13_01655 [archaeon]|nr:hypothetical protein [archaeon]
MEKEIRAILFLTIAFLLFGCIANQQEQGKGYLQGHITISPLCPVETNPPDPNCLPNEETYAAYVITVERPNGASISGREKVTEFTADKFGNYKIELEEAEGAEEYSLWYGSIQEPKFIKRFQIKAGETTNLDIDIDTGIR